MELMYWNLCTGTYVLELMYWNLCTGRGTRTRRGRSGGNPRQVGTDAGQGLLGSRLAQFDEASPLPESA